MKVSIICPLYNASKYLENLNKNLLKQNKEGIDEVEVLYTLTECKDNTKELLQKNNCNYIEIKPEDFSHSKTRALAASRVQCDILVFISQDVIMKNDRWLINLVRPIINGEAEAGFSRQICKYNNIEKYTRENNYPEKSRVVSKADIGKYGLFTFFYSDASSSISKRIYDELKAYDDKDLIINEDMYLAHKLIHAGYKIKYCADSEIFHSHDFTLKQLYQRYFDTGVFLHQNPVLNSYGTTESGGKLAKHITIRAIKDKNIKVLFNILPNLASRLIGKKLGEKYEKLPKGILLASSSSKGYWKRRGLIK